MRLIPHIILRVEPRTSSLGTAAEGDSVPGCTPLTVVRVVYPGMYSRGHTAGCTSPYTHQGAYTGCTSPYTPSGYIQVYPLIHHPEVYPP